MIRSAVHGHIYTCERLTGPFHCDPWEFYLALRVQARVSLKLPVKPWCGLWCLT